MPPSTETLTFIITITGFPSSTTCLKQSASIACGASSVRRNKIRSAVFAASKASRVSSSPSKAPIPGTSVTESPFHSYLLMSLVVLCAPFPIDIPSPSVRTSISVDLPAMVLPKSVIENEPIFSARSARFSSKEILRSFIAPLIFSSWPSRSSVIPAVSHGDCLNSITVLLILSSAEVRALSRSSFSADAIFCPLFADCLQSSKTVVRSECVILRLRYGTYYSITEQ